MAVIFPAGIYTEGQGLFDSMKYARMIEARKKAKQEAFAKYNDKLLGSINPAGVRDVDYPYITKDIENLQRYGIQNKTDIARGGESRLQFERMVRDVSQRIDQSKNAGKFQLEMAQMVLDKKIDPRDDDMKIAEKMQFSIYDPRFYKEYHVSQAKGLPEYTQNTGTMWSKEDLTPAIPVLKPEEKTKYFDFGIKDKKPQYNKNIPLETVGNQRIATFTYTPKDLKEGAERVAAEVRVDPIDFEGRRLKKTYESHMDDKSWMTTRDPVFQKYFNRPINTIADAAAADFLYDKEGVRIPEKQTIPRPTAGRRGGAGGTQIEIWDAYNELKPVLEKESEGFIRGATGKLFSPINKLGSAYYNLFVKQLKERQDADQKVYPTYQTYVSLEPDGKIGMYLVSEKGAKSKLITIIDERGLNRLANPGQKGYSEVEKKLKTKPAVAPATPAAPVKKGKGSGKPIF